MTEELSFRNRVNTVIFGTETTGGNLFDRILLTAILCSVTVVMLDSVDTYHQAYGELFLMLEYGFTIAFAIEYLLRLWCSEQRVAYALSFWGIVDLLAILPTVLMLFAPEAAALLVIRLLRVLRIFRILHLFELQKDYFQILDVLKATSRSIAVFLSIVMVTVVVFGCLLYVIEGPDNGFTSIPMSIYWAVVTVTTVGYGDIVPTTLPGRFVASVGILIGYSILAIPTAIITSNLIEYTRKVAQTLKWSCQVCGGVDHALDAQFCKHCGAEMEVPDELREKAKAK